MDIILVYGFVLLHYSTIAKGTADVFELDTKLTWDDAIKRTDCNIATPSLIPEGSGLPIDVIQDKVWVGYYRTKVIFEYLGCIADTRLNAAFLLDGYSVGMCYSLCRQNDYQIVGINGNKCFCMDVESIKEFSCAATEEQDTIGVYKAYLKKYSLTGAGMQLQDGCGGEPTTNCLRIDRFDETTSATWTSCACPSVTICLENNYTQFEVKQEGLTWRTSMRSSVKECGSVISLEDITKIKTKRNISHAWSGVIRNNVIFRYSDRFTENHTAIYYGYWKKTDSGHVLRFQKDSSERMPVLCNSASTLQESTTFSTTKIVGVDESGQSTADQSSNATIVIGVVVSVIVVIVVVGVIVFVYLRKRQNPPDFCKCLTKETGGDDQQQNVSNFNSENEYDELSGEITNHEYSQAFERHENPNTSVDYQNSRHVPLSQIIQGLSDTGVYYNESFANQQ